MTPIEKAIDLVSKFFNNDFKNITSFECAEDEAKKCALIAVDEMINEIKEFDDEFGFSESRLNYWQEVKEEIEKL